MRVLGGRYGSAPEHVHRQAGAECVHPVVRPRRGPADKCWPNQQILENDCPETYFADVKEMPRDAIFQANHNDTDFIWCKNTLMFSLQFLLWLGYRTIIFSGVELKGQYFADFNQTEENKILVAKLLLQEFDHMAWFAQAARMAGIKLYNTSPTSRLTEIEGFELLTGPLKGCLPKPG